jgi:hypothetical protein
MGRHNLRRGYAGFRLPAGRFDVIVLLPVSRLTRAMQEGGKSMTRSMTVDPAIEPRLLRGWISRYDLARELGLTVDTLGRWERRRKGPACVRAGRKALYRMSVVQD